MATVSEESSLGISTGIVTLLKGQLYPEDNRKCLLLERHHFESLDQLVRAGQIQCLINCSLAEDSNQTFVIWMVERISTLAIYDFLQDMQMLHHAITTS